MNIRNFTIIAHIDHGKSTLADRFLELTGTIEKRKMREQVLDQMPLERERGITIKMTPVCMDYVLNNNRYTLNLIDTPGHIDFSYEVSRALSAVEGAILLVDATQGVQAQTLSTLNLARELGLKIIPVVSKIDAPLAATDSVKKELADLLSVPESSVLLTSGRTGEGVRELLKAIIEEVPAPTSEYKGVGSARALVFDFEYSNHQGVIVYARIKDGIINRGDKLVFVGAKEFFGASEVGVFTPDKSPRDKLSAGEIGYIVTGIKRPGLAAVGDTITLAKNPLPLLSGYKEPKPVVWASFYPESQDDFDQLKDALSKLKLSDSALSYEEEASGVLGRGFRVGFLGMLHLEIISERIKREFGVPLVVTTPSINYRVLLKNGEFKTIYTPALFPDEGTYEFAEEPWVLVSIITPPEYVGGIVQILHEHESSIKESHLFSENRVSVSVEMPLRELMRNFFDRLKSISSGFASLSYEVIELRPADVSRLDILIADELVPAFARVVSKKRLSEEAERIVEKIWSVLPKQLFEVKVQARSGGRIISSRTIRAIKKNVTAHLYGGDVTRKMKLREKQKKGKKKMKYLGRVNIPEGVFLKVMKE